MKKEELLELISKNAPDLVIIQLKSSENNLNTNLGELALLSGRLEALKSRVRKGTINEENKNIEQNRINDALIELILEYRPKRGLPKKSKKRRPFIQISIFGILAILIFFILYQLNIIETGPRKEEPSSSDTIPSQKEEVIVENLIKINTLLKDSITLEIKILKNRTNTVTEFNKILDPTLSKLMNMYGWDEEAENFWSMGKEDCFLHFEQILKKHKETLKIVNQVEISDEYPTWSYTISNKTGSPQIISQFEMFIINAPIWMGIPESRVINSLAELNVVVPDKVGRYSYNMNKSIYIANDDAVTIDVRYCSKGENKHQDFDSKSELIYPASDRAPFFLSTIFISDENLYAHSYFVLLDNSEKRNTNQLLDNLNN